MFNHNDFEFKNKILETIIDYMIANRIPIYSDHTIVGAVGAVIFKDTKALNKE